MIEVTQDDIEAAKLFPKTIYAMNDAGTDDTMTAHHDAVEVLIVSETKGHLVGVYRLVEVRVMEHRDSYASKLAWKPK